MGTPIARSKPMSFTSPVALLSEQIIVQSQRPGSFVPGIFISVPSSRMLTMFLSEKRSPSGSSPPPLRTSSPSTFAEKSYETVAPFTGFSTLVSTLRLSRLSFAFTNSAPLPIIKINTARTIPAIFTPFGSGARAARSALGADCFASALRRAGFAAGALTGWAFAGFSSDAGLAELRLGAAVSAAALTCLPVYLGFPIFTDSYSFDSAKSA